MNPPTGSTPVSEWSLRRRNARRSFARSDCSFEESDTNDLVGLRAWGDVWDSSQDVKVARSCGSLRPPPSRRARPPRGARSVLLFVASCLLGLACSGKTQVEHPPIVPLTSSIEAQTELRGLQASFAQSTRAERLGLEKRLLAFETRFPRDALTPVADVMLAWIALERGDIERAKTLANKAYEATNKRGTTADLATMIEGAAERRAGNAEKAYKKLVPLLGKLIDAHARAFLNEEVTASALGAKRYDKAIDLMLVWLSEAGVEERAEVRVKLAELLAGIPPAALLPVLEARRRDHPEPQGEELDVQQSLAQRLAEAAIAARDSALAARLLGSSGPLLSGKADAIAELAVGASGARVEAPTLGLVLPLRTDETRRRGTQVASGVAFGLGLPGSAARLVTRDDQGRIEGVDDALEGLSSDGAAIVIAGVDREEATIAAKFAARESIPVVLLSAPAADTPPSPFVFVLGEEPERVRKALVAALPTKGQLVWVGDRGSVDMSKPESFECQSPPPAWRGIGGVAVYGSCVPDILLATSGSQVRVAVGLDLEGVTLPKGTLAAVAGVYPVDPRATQNPSLQAWLKVHPDPPSFWAGLGRDAAVLAWIGVQVLPTEGTKDPKEVKARREKAAQALAEASGELWTSEAKGFGGARVLPRTIAVREVR